jgi:predicted short-subunit dehydrogenase-like oxidoreductase (DUF2520 family)
MIQKAKSPSRKSTKAHSKKRRVAIIGAGRLGTTLGRALKDQGYSIDIVVTEHESSARRAAKEIGRGTRWLTTSDLSEPESSGCKPFAEIELFLIATPDDWISETAKRLEWFLNNPIQLSYRNARARRRVAFHHSGVLDSSVLDPLTSAGFAIASLHPLVSVSESSPKREIFRKAWFSAEGDTEALAIAQTIVRDLQGKIFIVERDAKALYHAAAVMVSGHAVALFDIAVEMFRRCGLAYDDAREALLPLLQTTLQNLADRDPAGALTGPFARGDIKTVQKHLDALRSAGVGRALETYLLLARRSLQLAKSRGIDGKIIEKIAEILDTAASQNSPRQS